MRCRYVAGELKPEDFAETVKELVDKHSIIIAFQCPSPAPVVKAEPEERDANDSVFVKPNGKRGAAGDSAKGRGKSSKSDKSASVAAGASAAGPSQKAKRKSPAGSSGEAGSRALPKSARSGGYGEAGAASGKVLKGALTPVASAAGEEEGGAGDEENSAWDALLSVCALMPRQKAK